MKRRILLFATLTFAGLVSPGAPLCAQDTPEVSGTLTPPAPPAVSTSTSPNYPAVSCTSTDALACTDTLQLASDTRDALGPLLNLGPTWRFPVHIHILTPDDPLTAKINREASAVFAQGSTMKIEAVLPSTDLNAREFVQRQFVTALLWEKYFANTTTFDKDTHLDAIPLWLVEGLRERLNDDPEHNREAIVRRSVKAQTSPTLDQILGWHELSDDRLLGLWQRAFCYYLVDSLVQTGPKRDDFQLWLAGLSGPNASRAQLHFPTEADWQQEIANATARGNDIVYSWGDTESELAANQTITYAASKDAKVQTCTLDQITTLPRDKIVLEAVQEKIFALTQLELRGNTSWHAIIEIYRNALTSFVNGDDLEKVKSLLEQAHHWRNVQADYHQKLLDYVNWFEVTKDYEDGPSHFEVYFTTAKEMERVEADPAHRNPIRANLLEIESQL
jgi:hypothetical protein